MLGLDLKFTIIHLTTVPAAMKDCMNILDGIKEYIASTMGTDTVLQ